MLEQLIHRTHVRRTSGVVYDVLKMFEVPALWADGRLGKCRHVQGTILSNVQGTPRRHSLARLSTNWAIRRSVDVRLFRNFFQESLACVNGGPQIQPSVAPLSILIIPFPSIPSAIRIPTVSKALYFLFLVLPSSQSTEPKLYTLRQLQLPFRFTSLVI